MPRIARLLFSSDDDDQEGANRQTISLAGMAVALLLVVVSLFLVRQLHTKTLLEDCMLAGRTNCDLMVAGTR